MKARLDLVALAGILAAGALALDARAQPPPPPPPPPTTTPQRSTLTAESTPTVRIKEGGEADFDVVFTVDPALPSGITVDQDGSGAENAITARVTDVRSSAGDLFSTMTVDTPKIRAGRTQIDVPLSADAGDGLDGGDYTGNVVVSGSGISPGRTAVTLKLVEIPFGKEWERYLVAAGLLLAGVMMGALLTWLNSQGSKLVAAQRRLAGIDARLRGLQPLPSGLTSRLAIVRQALIDYDQKTATEELDKITAEQIDTLTALLTRLRGLNSQLSTAAAQLPARPGLPQEARLALSSAVDAGQNALTDLAQRSWPPADVAEEERTFRKAMAALIRLVEYWATKERWSADATEAAGLFTQRRWAEAEKAVDELEESQHTPTEAAASVGPTAGYWEWLTSDLSGTSPGDDRRWRPGVRLFLLKRFNFIAGCLVAVGVVLVGLTGVFDPDTTFNDPEDFVKLIGWGIGTQTVGVTLAQLGNTLIGDRVKLAG